MNENMVKTDTLHFNAQEKLRTGIGKIAKAVGGTMGTAGSNTVIEAIESPGHLLTNDGYTIASSIVLADPIEDMGRKMLLESISRANKASGDGSSTTCVLTAAIIEAGLTHGGDNHPMDIKRSLEECVPYIDKSLKEQSKQLVVDGTLDLALLEEVATISAEDADIGKRIAEIYSKIGHEGIIYWDISKTADDYYTVGSGITVEGAGFVSPYMCDAAENGANTNQIRIANPYILLTKQKISSAADFNDIASDLFGRDIKDLVVFADDIDPLVIPDLIRTRAIKGFRIAVVKMPVLWKDWWFEDLAHATGATTIDSTAGLPMRELKFEHLGRIGNIVITKDDTYLDGIKDVTKHVEELKKLDTEEGDLRVSRLNTKTARYFVGAQSDSALSYRRLKVEDAIGASWQALRGGIVPGGGTALINAIQALPNTVGGSILTTALCKPTAQIMQNAGYTPKKVGTTFVDEWKRISGTIGFNSHTKEFVDMFEAGIVDPTNVVLNAVKNAVSVAATVITAPTIVTLPREELTPLSQGN